MSPNLIRLHWRNVKSYKSNQINYTNPTGMMKDKRQNYFREISFFFPPLPLVSCTDYKIIFLFVGFLRLGLLLLLGLNLWRWCRSSRSRSLWFRGCLCLRKITNFNSQLCVRVGLRHWLVCVHVCPWITAPGQLRWENVRTRVKSTALCHLHSLTHTAGACPCAILLRL